MLWLIVTSGLIPALCLFCFHYSLFFWSLSFFLLWHPLLPTLSIKLLLTILFHSAGTSTRRCTEASVQVSPSWQPQPGWQECIYSLVPLCQEWMRAAPRNSCSRSDQKTERLLWLPPLCLPPHLNFRTDTEWAASQGNDLIFEMRVYLYVFWFQINLLELNPTHYLQTSAELNYDVCKCVSLWAPTIPQFVLTLHPFVTISLGAYHWRVNL